MQRKNCNYVAHNDTPSVFLIEMIDKILAHEKIR